MARFFLLASLLSDDAGNGRALDGFTLRIFRFTNPNHAHPSAASPEVLLGSVFFWGGSSFYRGRVLSPSEERHLHARGIEGVV
jgi:hypothetical protein